MNKKQNFIEFCASKGYKPYRKVFNSSLKEWQYIETDTSEYCSSSSPGYMDIRLIKEGEKEIVWGIPGMFKTKDNGKLKTHFPTLIYPNPFGKIHKVDRAFKYLSFEEILKEIENFKTRKRT